VRNQEELGMKNSVVNQAPETMLGIVDTGTLLNRQGRPLRRFGLTEAQFNILMLLRRQPDNGRMNQARLVGLLENVRAQVRNNGKGRWNFFSSDSSYINSS